MSFPHGESSYHATLNADYGKKTSINEEHLLGDVGDVGVRIVVFVPPHFLAL